MFRKWAVSWVRLPAMLHASCAYWFGQSCYKVDIWLTCLIRVWACRCFRPASTANPMPRTHYLVAHHHLQCGSQLSVTVLGMSGASKTCKITWLPPLYYHQLDSSTAKEMVEFSSGVCGMCLNLEADNIGVSIFSNECLIKGGNTMKCTSQIVNAPIGPRLSWLCCRCFE